MSPLVHPHVLSGSSPATTSEREEGLLLDVIQSRPAPLEAALACPPGKVLALVGPSGSGKTTLLRSIAGLVRPATGRIQCGGETWFDSARGLHLPPRQRRVGFVFQQYGLFPHLSALENVAESLTHLPREERGAQARHWLDRVHLHGLGERKPHQMSGGQQQRVAMARALARNPEVLLMDEPFSAVDRVTREKLYLELSDLLRGLAIPMVLVTHDLDEAAMLADRMVLLSKGRTLQSGTPDEVMLNPESAEAARLTGNRNVFAAVVREADATRGELLLAWGADLLRARHRGGFAPGQAVAWAVSPGDVIFRHAGHPEDHPDQTYLQGRITAMVRQGDLLRVILALGEGEGRSLQFTASRHLAQRSGLQVGGEVRVSIPVQRVHVFPLPGEGGR